MNRFEFLEDRLALSGAPAVTGVVVASSQWTSAFVERLENDGLGDGGYAIPTGSSAQTAPIPWDGIDQIMIQFNEDVNVDASDLSISGVNTVTHGVSDFFYDAETYIATWHLASPTSVDKTQLDLNGDNLDPVADLDGNVLDGEWTDNSTSGESGNGIAGGDFEFSVNYLAGDVDQSGMVDYDDLIAVAQKLGLDSDDAAYDPIVDINGDGQMVLDDYWITLHYGTSILPMGQPAGASNDAPTSSGLARVQIEDDAVDEVISLFDAFGDGEDDDDDLSYQIVSNNEPSLFDTVAIDQALGELTLNSAGGGAYGRATLRIRATDTAGLTVDEELTVDILRDNFAPQISLDATQTGEDTWVFNGVVSDADDDPTGWQVDVLGLVNKRVSVSGPDGSFSFGALIDPDMWGIVLAKTEGVPHGAKSNVATTWVADT